jgi:hypothetical protein
VFFYYNETKSWEKFLEVKMSRSSVGARSSGRSKTAKGGTVVKFSRQLSCIQKFNLCEPNQDISLR